ncbi:class I adenylate-forming enzyme family protein [Nocardia miyunensis]|uniref:class I adenylate-forming enzyme family protein n=1 Tax=Nocardia miyunensis TaxID=282684 RepID=UPI00082BB486|nr:class I adenylate-forming enzyme family protein [Nocardia miyunensis]
MAAPNTAVPEGVPGSIPELLAARRADRDGEFLVTDQQRLTFATADRDSLELAEALLASGVGKGTRVGILFPNCTEWLVAWLAAARIGALTVPLSTFAPGAELARLLRHTDTQVLLTGQAIAGRNLVERLQDALPGLADGGPSIAVPQTPYLRRIHVWPSSDRPWASAWPHATKAHASLVDSAEREVRPADDLVLVTTSGTTALPKSIVHTHAGLVRHAYLLARHRGVSATDRIYSPMPFFWVGGLTMVVLQALSTGATILAQDVFEAGKTLELLERERATFISCWPQASKAMADHPDFDTLDLSSVRGGTLLEALPPQRRPAEPDLMPNMLGMTETGGPHTMAEVPDTPLPPELRGSFGIPLPGVEHRIVDPDGGVLPSGEEGEIHVRGLVLMDRIYKRERHEVLTADGWYPTGDRGWFDQRGHLHFTGRASALIKTAGSNVSPAEVESVLDAMDQVLHSFVVDLPHPVRGQVVAAVVVPSHGAELSVDAVIAYARRNLSSFKVPTVVRVLGEEDLPMLPTGKVDRQALVRILNAG